MTREQIEQICRDRLNAWAKIATDHHATPCLLVAIGHDDVSGEIHLLVPEQFTFDEINRILKKVLEMIQ